MSNSSSSAAAAGAGGAVIEPRFGQVVIGPPGSGKTTYCKGLSQYCAAIGRPVAIVNLDPANDALPYDVAVDIADLIQLDEVMEQMGLGPNGGLIYCLEHLEKNSDWLVQKIAALMVGPKGGALDAAILQMLRKRPRSLTHGDARGTKKKMPPPLPVPTGTILLAYPPSMAQPGPYY